MSRKSFTFALLLFTTPVYAHDECCSLDQRIEVASLKEVFQSQSGKAVAVLDQYLVDQYRESRVVDALSGIPGVETKNIPGVSTVRIRGMRSFDTGYLFNGVPMKDPTDPQGSFTPFLNDVMVLGTNEIQVLKGVGSALYGTDSMAGVVDIVPKEDPYSFLFEAGKERKEELTAPFGSIVRLDGRDSENTSFRVGHKWEHIEPWFIYTNSTAPLNNAPFVSGGEVHVDENDENNRSEKIYLHGGAKISYDPWQWTVAASESERRFIFLPNADGSDFYSDGTFKGRTFFSDFSVNVLGVSLGYVFERDFYFLRSVGNDEIDRYQNDLYAEREFEIGNLRLLLGVRENLHESAKHRTVVDGSAVYSIPDWDLLFKLHGGTGYRTPSLYELAGAFLTDFGRFEIGNLDLSPERSTSFDVGVEKRFGKNIGVGVTYFESKVVNRINLVGSQYQNVDGHYNPHGIEVWYEQFLFGCASLRFAYTQTLAENLVDIGRHSLDGSLRVHKGKWDASIRGRFRDSHTILLFDYDTFSVDRMKEDGSVTFDATIGYKLRENFEVYIRADNLFSEDYTQSGYRQEGARVYAGVKISA